MFRYCLLTLALAGLATAQSSHFGGSATGGVSSSSLAREMVASHNAVRARVGTAPLRWSDTLASFAQQWANQLIQNGQFAHSHNPKYGENLYEISGGAATPASVVKTWAEEVHDYDYGTNTCRGVCGHYTQVVWRDTSKVGCAVARTEAREVWVCEYDPPGNWVGRKPY